MASHDIIGTRSNQSNDGSTSIW